MTEGGVRQVEVEAKADFESTLAQGQLPCYAMAGIEVPPNKPLSGYKVHWSITQPVTGAGTGQLLRVATNYGQFFMGGGNQAQITDGSGKAKVLLDVASERSPGSGDLQHKTVVVRATLDKDDFPFKLGDLMGVRAPGFALSKSWDLVLSAAKRKALPSTPESINVAYHDAEAYSIKDSVRIIAFYYTMPIDLDLYTCEGIDGPWHGTVKFHGDIDYFGDPAEQGVRQRVSGDRRPVVDHRLPDAHGRPHPRRGDPGGPRPAHRRPWRDRGDGRRLAPARSARRVRRRSNDPDRSRGNTRLAGHLERVRRVLPHPCRRAGPLPARRVVLPMSRRAGLIFAAVSIAALLIACSPSPSQPPSSIGPVSSSPMLEARRRRNPTIGATFDPNATPQPVAFEGLYVGSDLSVTGDATVTVIRSVMTCAALEHVIGASEWSIVGRQVQAIGLSADGSTLTMIALENGDESAIAWLAGGNTCTARVARTTSVPIKVSGVDPYEGPAAMDQPFCVTTGETVALGATFRTPGGPNVQVSVVAPARIGTARLDPDDVTLHTTPGVMSTTQLAGIVIEAFKDSTKGYFADEYVPVEASRARLDVETIDPFSGTLHLTDFQGDADAISVDARVECHLPGGTLKRAAEAAAVPAGTPPPGTPGPTLAPFDGAAPGTAVATGTVIAGTYQLPASGLDCYFDFDQGAWTFLTVGGADPTFYLYAFAGQGGGSTDRVSMGLIVGDGGNGRLLLFDTSVAPPNGTAQAQVAASGGEVTVVAQARAADGATLAVNLSCPGS